MVKGTYNWQKVLRPFLTYIHILDILNQTFFGHFLGSILNFFFDNLSLNWGVNKKFPNRIFGQGRLKVNKKLLRHRFRPFCLISKKNVYTREIKTLTKLSAPLILICNCTHKVKKNKLYPNQRLKMPPHEKLLKKL